MDLSTQTLSHVNTAQEILLGIAEPILAIQGEVEGAGETATPGPLAQFLPFIAIGALAWFLLIAPERKRQKARLAMLGNIKKNDKVVTNGGIIGTVTKVDDSQMTLRIADGVNVHVERHAVSRVVTVAKGKDEDEEEVKE